jgi:hypothetical protein
VGTGGVGVGVGIGGGFDDPDPQAKAAAREATAARWSTSRDTAWAVQRTANHFQPAISPSEARSIATFDGRADCISLEFVLASLVGS